MYVSTIDFIDDYSGLEPGVRGKLAKLKMSMLAANSACIRLPSVKHCERQEVANLRRPRPDSESLARQATSPRNFTAVIASRDSLTEDPEPFTPPPPHSISFMNGPRAAARPRYRTERCRAPCAAADNRPDMPFLPAPSPCRSERQPSVPQLAEVHLPPIRAARA